MVRRRPNSIRQRDRERPLVAGSRRSPGLRQNDGRCPIAAARKDNHTLDQLSVTKDAANAAAFLDYAQRYLDAFSDVRTSSDRLPPRMQLIGQPCSLGSSSPLPPFEGRDLRAAARPSLSSSSWPSGNPKGRTSSVRTQQVSPLPHDGTSSSACALHTRMRHEIHVETDLRCFMIPPGSYCTYRPERMTWEPSTPSSR